VCRITVSFEDWRVWDMGEGAFGGGRRVGAVPFAVDLMTSLDGSRLGTDNSLIFGVETSLFGCSGRFDDSRGGIIVFVPVPLLSTLGFLSKFADTGLTLVLRLSSRVSYLSRLEWLVFDRVGLGDGMPLTLIGRVLPPPPPTIAATGPRASAVDARREATDFFLVRVGCVFPGLTTPTLPGLLSPSAIESKFVTGLSAGFSAG
jgi:hypothetical protein